jgi:hypothetical protein
MKASTIGGQPGGVQSTKLYYVLQYAAGHTNYIGQAAAYPITNNNPPFLVLRLFNLFGRFCANQGCWDIVRAGPPGPTNPQLAHANGYADLIALNAKKTTEQMG